MACRAAWASSNYLLLLVRERAVVLCPGEAPFLQANRLVLQGMRQLVGQHCFLQLRLHPVEQIHRLGFGIVVSRHLLAQQLQKLGVQIVVRRDHAEFLQHQLRAFEALGVLVILHPLLDVALHLIASDELAFHLVLNGEASVLADELENLVNRAEEFLRLGLSDGLLRLRRRRLSLR